MAEIIKELHLNSFKHGRATECVVTLGWGESGTVVLTMRNNGSPLSSRISPETGLGDTFLDSVSLSSSTADSAEARTQAYKDATVVLAETGALVPWSYQKSAIGSAAHVGGIVPAFTFHILTDRVFVANQ